MVKIGRNCPFDRIYNEAGELKPEYQRLTRIKCKKAKSKITKERMRNFMMPDSMHQCLSEVLEKAYGIGYSHKPNNKSRLVTTDAETDQQPCDFETLVHQKLSNGMEIGDFCLQCIMTRWAF